MSTKDLWDNAPAKDYQVKGEYLAPSEQLKAFGYNSAGEITNPTPLPVKEDK